MKKTIAVLACILSASIYADAQESLTLRADKLYEGYRFSEAIETYADAMVKTKDSAELLHINRRIAMCEAAEELLDYALTPKVVATINVPLKEMPLYLSSIQGRWIQIPNPFVSSTGNPFVTATCLPDDLTTVIFSAPDTSGKWSIYTTTQKNDTLWSEPELLSPILTSSGNEIFPFVSPGGMELYFASDGMVGMGGYDLYVSIWDESSKQWGEPSNVGFPYSSIDDDLLLFNTYDGNWTVSASTRDCAAGTVNLYLTEYEVSPDTKDMSDIQAITNAAAMKPLSAQKTVSQNKPASTNPEFRQYEADFRQMIAAQRKCEQIQDRLNSLRAEQGDAAIIAKLERDLPLAISEKTKAENTVRAAEMEFLKQNIVPPVIEVEDIPEAKTETSFEFKRGQFSAAPKIVLECSEPPFDFSFRKGDESVIADRDIIPNGLIYQIQLTVLSAQASPSRFKGYSPIFEHRYSSGKYQYTAGAFTTYSQAASALSKLQKIGFSNAYVIAFWDKKSIQVKDARTKEKNGDGSSYKVIISGFDQGLPASVKSAISANSTKDLAKSSTDGGIVYIIGPFSSKAEADNLAGILKQSGAPNTSVETVK